MFRRNRFNYIEENIILYFIIKFVITLNNYVNILLLILQMQNKKENESFNFII